MRSCKDALLFGHPHLSEGILTQKHLEKQQIKHQMAPVMVMCSKLHGRKTI